MPDMEHWPTGRLLSTAARLVEHAWNERLVRIGVTHAGVIALGVLDSQGPMTQAHLAQIVRVQAQTMGKTLSRLEAHGHVVRVRNDLDRRSHMVSITPEGVEALREAQDIESTLTDGGDLMSDELRRQLRNVIKELGNPRWQLAVDVPGLPIPVVPAEEIVAAAAAEEVPGDSSGVEAGKTAGTA
ncbi:MarR family winged helix-turn-helix transcriptional regulator [Arthrobacter sp. zg-Y820]|uniref:MarR family winged helix-turn-helix transcriptional regulator n=1 Tax=unclassified Arthrobacter TaxID=235627 RepID=UPI001E29CB18|nr:MULTISPECIES: MarR family winged helix-turn-helix transcriptional regulator [unclassified Arthrobacter]MCC9196160.1 MarR family winged helix-turn-helix transcriptional regulator [Arthrobacter sp. zg-Y820]MDK1279020.1 MarR family winged helix-turn-helix transcriptional regulator [Arthrobacter sp. zg.Y820]WIB08570.1 MarR family winged helix-turn-helix transcriptional regulator [Arthrobacter sp. zg-Y820]